MEKKRYSKVFWRSIRSTVALLLVFTFFCGYLTVAAVLYYTTTRQMLTAPATIHAVEIDQRRRSMGYDQELAISYELDGVVYQNRLDVYRHPLLFWEDVPRFRVGQVMEIYYDPQDPAKIESPYRSDMNLLAFLLFAFLDVFCILVLIWEIKTRDRYWITEEAFAKEKTKKDRQKARIEAAAKNGGRKIRRQYLNGLLYILFCVFWMVLLLLLLNTWFGQSGAGIQSAAECIALFLGFAILTAPFWIFSLCNRRFFGKTVCVISERGIFYRGRWIPWEAIREMQYIVCVATDGLFENRGVNGRILLRGDDLERCIDQAPLLLLRAAKRYHPTLRISLSKQSKLWLLSAPVGVTLLAVLLFWIV